MSVAKDFNRAALYNLASRLVHRYESTDTGLQGLETWLNTQVLRRAIERAGETVLDGEGENLYRLLSDDGVMDSARESAERQLRVAGVTCAVSVPRPHGAVAGEQSLEQQLVQHPDSVV